MAQHRDGSIFLGTDNGIALINPDSLSIKGLITMRNGLPDNIIRQLFINGDSIWLGTDEKGVCILDAKSHTVLAFSDWTYNPVSKMVIHNGNECWVTTAHDGLIHLALDSNRLLVKKQFTMVNGLPTNFINTIYSDFENNLWCGSNEGVSLLANSPFEFINSELNGFNFGNTYCFVTDKKNNYWAATEGGLIKFVIGADGKADYKIIKFNQFNATSFISLYCDKSGYIWAGTYGNGVFRIHPESLEFKRYTSQNGLPDDNILHITGINDDVWMATAGGGAAVYHLVSGTFEIYNSNNGLATDYVYSVFPDSSGAIWFGLDGRGVSVLKNGKVTTVFLPDSLGIHSVYSIAGNNMGKYWFQTDDKGLLEFNGSRYRFLSDEKGDIGLSIRSILCNDDKLVIVNNESIQLLSIKTNSIETFGAERGVAYLEPNINGISCDRLNNIWISTNKGIVKLSTHNSNFVNSKPKIEITNKLLFSEPIIGQKNRFRYNENNLAFEFAGFWYQGSENLTYRYKILNYDMDWSRPVNIRQITYSNISPGEYTFMVEVSNNSGTWVSNPKARFSFVIRPPFYKTWWFIFNMHRYCGYGGLLLHQTTHY
jgi:ligand-binding sensor domain-containing protein